MAIPRYFAMTAQEFAHCKSLPKEVAWMACHFSPYTTGLWNLPPHLPDNSLLILNDSTPPSSHSPENIKEILQNILKNSSYSGILLDFQRQKCDKTQEIVQELIKLNCPVCVSSGYVENLDCPVFLPPVPQSIPLLDYIKPWSGREIWLDIALGCEEITITEKGSHSEMLITTDKNCTLVDQELHCHYCIEEIDDGFRFTLQRTKEDLEELLAEAESLGIRAAVGLYQELK